jgi:hypothetical protein
MLALVVAAGCGTPKTALTTAAPNGGTTPPLRACLESPTVLPRPPAGTLPCELIPPDLAL